MGVYFQLGIQQTMMAFGAVYIADIIISDLLIDSIINSTTLRATIVNMSGNEQELTLKVMRLSKPTVCNEKSIYLEQSHDSYAYDAYNHSFIDTERHSLPVSFGNIFLGETFCSYLSINNESELPVTDVGIKAEIQTTSQRFILLDNIGQSASSSASSSIANLNLVANIQIEASRQNLQSKTSFEFILSHEIKELGTHILVCTVQYKIQNERKQFRKFFKFQVLNPLAVKTKVNTLPDGKVLLEAQVQNTTTDLLYLEFLKFNPSELFEYVDMNLSESNSKVTIFGQDDVLQVKDVRQYLYLLNPKEPNAFLAKSTPGLGKLDIQWRSTMGQLGKLQTSQLCRKVIPSEPFDMFVTDFPSEIYAEKVFAINCLIVNHTSEPVRLTLSGIKNKMSSVLLSGFSEKAVGMIKPHGRTKITLSFFPLYSGLHKVSGLKLVDVISGVAKNVDHLIDLIILAPN